MTASVMLVTGQIALAVIALSIIYFDLRFMRIPDRLSLLLLGLFAAQCVAFGFPADVWMRLAVCLIVFGLGFVAFGARMLGGGDVKIMTALALFVPVHALAHVALTLSATLLLGTGVVVAVRWVNPAWSGWSFLRTSRMPMGVSIGAAALIAPLVLA